MGKILVVEDNDVLRGSVVQALVENGHNVSEVGDGEEATERLQEESYDVVLTDMRMPKKSGLEVLRFAKQVNDLTVAIVMTAFGTIESAVEAMKSGAYDYIQKPFELEELEVKINRALEHRRDSGVLQILRSQSSQALEHNNIVGSSPQIRKIFEIIKKIARSNASILITGETGTGKELIASLAHYNSLRAKQSFVKVNCAALQENLLESELFGHEEGAFTGAVRAHRGLFELAHGGTLFLDEVGEMPLPLQVKLLRALQDRRIRPVGGERDVVVDVRVIAATNRDLHAEMLAGRYRPDVYYRLAVVALTIPPLRERRADIPVLVQNHLESLCVRLNRRQIAVSDEAMLLLCAHDWPGNVRELANVLERAVLLGDGQAIGVRDLSGIVAAPRPERGDVNGASDLLQLPFGAAEARLRDEFERTYFTALLRECRGRLGVAARRAGLSPRTLYGKLQRLGMRKEEFKEVAAGG